jgi:uncharacterized protein YjiS (DUF1127 family)
MLRSIFTIREVWITASGPIETISRPLARILSEHRIHRDIKTLSQFSDYMLTDVGLSRTEIEHVVRYGRQPVRCDSMQGFQSWLY